MPDLSDELIVAACDLDLCTMLQTKRWTSRAIASLSITA